MLKVNELKQKLNITDEKGNQIKFDGKFLKVVIKGEKERDIGWLEMVDGKGLTYRKKELEKDRYRKTDAWSIPRIVLQQVDWIQYQSDERAYEIDAKKARLYGATTKAKVNLEEKVYVPVGAWTIFQSKDDKEQARINMFGIEWYNRLHDMIWSEDMAAISSFLANRSKINTVYPDFKNLFTAFKTTPLSKVKVVIMGNEPIQDSMADGFAFGYKLPFGEAPEIKYIQDELDREADDKMIDFNPKHVFDTEDWARQGCLMLNQCLSVEKDHQKTHEGIGWETFTERVIREVQAVGRPICFVLLGTRTYEYQKYIDTEYHTVIKADAYSSCFVGSNIFWEINGFLHKYYNTEIKW